MAGRGVLGVAAREHVVLLARGVQESGNPSSSQELHTGLLPRSSGVNLHPDHSNSVDIVDLHPDDPVLVTSMSCYTPPPAPPRPSRAEGVTPQGHMVHVGSKLRRGVVIVFRASDGISQQ